MNNLKELKAKIFEFVNYEFDLEDSQALEEAKQTLTLEKIDTLNNLLHDYKKSVKIALNAEKRKQALRDNQKNYKKLSTSVKVGEFEKYENDAKSKNLSISQYVKNAVENFIGSKTVSVDKVSIEKELLPYKQDIERLNKQLEESERLNNLKIENLEKITISFQTENEKLDTELTKYRELFEIQKTENRRLRETKNELKLELESKIENLENKGFFTKLFELFS